jgi:hypothetical protein
MHFDTGYSNLKAKCLNVGFQYGIDFYSRLK